MVGVMDDFPPTQPAEPRDVDSVWQTLDYSIVPEVVHGVPWTQAQEDLQDANIVLGTEGSLEFGDRYLMHLAARMVLHSRDETLSDIMRTTISAKLNDLCLYITGRDRL